MLPPRQPAPESPLLQALHRGDKDTLRGLYQQEAAGRSPLEVWRAASDGGRHDLQHAVLVLHPHHHIESRLAHAKRHAPAGAGPRPLNGELHRPLGTDAHESLVRHIKQVPYFSEKPERLTDANLNGQVAFADGGYNSHHTICCRHLATLWALQVLATGKPDYAAFGTEAALKQGVSSKMQPLYERLLTASAENHLVPLTDWGPFVSEQLRTIAASRDTASKVTLVSSGSHVMAMNLKVKHEPDGPLYVANFYDPNLTATHKRIASKDLGRFEKLRMDTLFKDLRSYEECFRNQSVVSVTLLPSGGEAEIPPLRPGGDPERRLTGRHPPLDESVVHHLMAGGFAGTLSDLLPEFAELAKKTPYQASTLLAGRSDDLPGLFAASMAGQAHAVRAFGKLLGLVPPHRHTWLLAARSSSNMPALRAAAAFDHADAVRAFIDCVSGTALTPAEQLPLLAARSSQKESTALGMALVLGHLDTVNAYLEGIAAHPGLAAKDRAELLSLQNEEGLPALAYGLLHGKPETVSAVTGWIAGQDFGESDHRKLLLAADREGTPALVHALRSDAADNLRAYVSAVTDSALDKADKLHVLTAGLGPADWQRLAAVHQASPALDACLDALRSVRDAS